MYYPFANTSDYKRDHPVIMDLLAAERRNGQHWNGAKIGAFFCFVVACGILIASLVLPPTPLVGNTNGLAANISAPAH
jgi:hypothetical protein